MDGRVVVVQIVQWWRSLDVRGRQTSLRQLMNNLSVVLDIGFLAAEVVHLQLAASDHLRPVQDVLRGRSGWNVGQVDRRPCL